MSHKFYTHSRNSYGHIAIKQKQIHQKKQLNIEVQDGVFFYQTLREVIRKHIRYPFQLLKQYFLFPEEDEESIQVNYKYMRYDMEIAVENVRAVTGLMRQRNLIDGFVTIKNAYNRRLRVQAAYRNIKNLVHFTKVIVTIETIIKVQIKWQGFRKLYENLKHLKLSKISVSKISMISNELPSREFDDMNPLFVGKGRQIDNSFNLDVSNFHQSQQSEYGGNRDILQRFKRDIKENLDSQGKQKIRRKTERKSMNLSSKTKKQNQQKIPFIEQKKRHKGSSPIINEDEKQSKNLIVQKKSRGKQKVDTHPPQVQIKQGQNQTQQIFLIHNYHSKRKPPSNFIKIPVISQNVKIVEINTGRRRKQDKREEESPFHQQQNSCVNCKYCRLMRERRQIMKMVEQKLSLTNRDTGTRLHIDNLLSSITFHSKNEQEQEHGTSPSMQQIPSQIYNKYSSSALNKQYPTLTNQPSIMSKRLDFTPRHNKPSPNIWPCEF